MQWFKSMGKKSCLGVEFADSLVRLMEIDAGKSPEIKQLVEISVAEGEEPSVILAEAVKANSWQKKSAAFSLPDRLVFSQEIKVPVSFKGAMLEQQLLYEVHQHLPYAVESTYYDYQSLSSDSDSQTFLFVAAKKEDVCQTQEVLIQSGLKPVLADTIQYALSRAVAAQYPDLNEFSLLFLGHGVVSLTLNKEGMPVYHNEQKLDAHQGQSPESLTSVIGRLLSWLENSGQELGDQPLILAGDLATAMLCQDLQQQHHLKVQLFDLALDHPSPSSWALCYGLALGGLER